MTEDLRALLDAAPPVVDRCEYGEGPLAFSVDIQRLDKPTLEAIGLVAMRTIRDRRGERREPNLDAFRKALRDHCLRGWDGLTLGTLFALCGRRPPEGTVLEQGVPFTPGNALVLLERARTPMDGTVVAFDDFVFEKANATVAEQSAEETAVKNG